MAKTVPKSIHNSQRYLPQTGKKLTKICGTDYWIWQSAVAPSDAGEKTAIWVHNYNPSGA